MQPDIRLTFIVEQYFFKQVRVAKPTTAQRDYYDGRKGFHCKNYLYVHDGTGMVVNVHGGERGADNDNILLNRSMFKRRINQYVAFGDYVLCDGAWRHEGLPFLTRFTDREYLTAGEMAFNYVLSEKRVICENYYGRLHNLFPILNHFKLRVDKLDVFVRALSLMTNVHIQHQSPLR